MSELDPSGWLFVPHRKRLSHSYAINSDGVRELRIDYGIKEVTFDEERLFAFGEQLGREPAFRGQDATAWGPGYDWDEIRPLLEALLEEGILQRGEGDQPHSGGLVPSMVPPSSCPVSRMWSLADCESITRDLGNHSFEIGYIEAVLPVFRIAHPALDGDHRQVGEANVFPPRLRLDHTAEWRVCQYSGSRYRDDKPMNVTALKAMIKHWKPILTAIGTVCAELGRRFDTPPGRWTIGQLHVLSSIVLALPTFQLMQRGGTSPQPLVHPVLSSLFRITDGIRMTTFEMLFAVEGALRSELPITAEELFEYAERQGVLLGDTGVCAGPEHLIREFLGVVVDGDDAEGLSSIELPPEVRTLLDQVPVVTDYGLLGLQVWCVSAALWFAVSSAYEALFAVLDGAPNAGGEQLAQLRARVRSDWEMLGRLRFSLDHDRDLHWKAYEDAYALVQRIVRSPIGLPTLAEETAIGPEQPMHRAAANRLRTALTARLAGAADAPTIDRLVDALVHYLRREQAILASAVRIQQSINALLDRPRPQRTLGGEDLHANYVMSDSPLPYVLDALDQAVGVRVRCTVDAIEISHQ